MALFWLKWLIANVGSAVIVNYAIQATAPLLERVVLHSVARTLTSEIFIFLYRAWSGGFLGALAVGFAIGTAQWLVLRTQIPLPRKYILATSLGLGSAGFLINYNYIGAVGGAIVGLAQWLVLRRFLPQAGWWVLANTFGWGLGGFLGFLAFSRLNPYTSSFDVVVNSGILIAAGTTSISAAITGLVLVWLLNHKKRTSSIDE